MTYRNMDNLREFTPSKSLFPCNLKLFEKGQSSVIPSLLGWMKRLHFYYISICTHHSQAWITGMSLVFPPENFIVDVFHQLQLRALKSPKGSQALNFPFCSFLPWELWLNPNPVIFDFEQVSYLLLFFSSSSADWVHVGGTEVLVLTEKY